MAELRGLVARGVETRPGVDRSSVAQRERPGGFGAQVGVRGDFDAEGAGRDVPLREGRRPEAAARGRAPRADAGPDGAADPWTQDGGLAGTVDDDSVEPQTRRQSHAARTLPCLGVRPGRRLAVAGGP